MKKNSIRFTLRSFDHKVLDEAVRQIIIAGRKTGARFCGPIPMPNKRRVFTVLRGPHVDKKARDQYELVVHKRIIDFLSPQEQTMDALMRVVLSSSVDVKIS